MLLSIIPRPPQVTLTHTHAVERARRALAGGVGRHPQLPPPLRRENPRGLSRGRLPHGNVDGAAVRDPAAHAEGGGRPARGE